MQAGDSSSVRIRLHAYGAFRPWAALLLNGRSWSSSRNPSQMKPRQQVLLWLEQKMPIICPYPTPSKGDPSYATVAAMHQYIYRRK
jgi:hypothetical protein